MKNLKVEITEEYSVMPGYCRVVVKWTKGKTRHMQSSRVFSKDTDPRELAESLRGLGWSILKRCRSL